MRIPTKTIQPGNVTVTNETVISCERIGRLSRSPELKVVLEKESGKRRVAYWMYFGEVFIKSR